MSLIRVVLWLAIVAVSLSTIVVGQQTTGGGQGSGGTFTGDVYFKSGRPWIDALAIGFLCDGTTDDTAAMTNALQALYNQGGGTLMIPAAPVRTPYMASPKATQTAK